MITAAVIVLALIVLMFVTAPFWINWLWFGSVGYRSVIVTNYNAQALLFLAAAVIAGLIFYVNMRLALRNTRSPQLAEEGRVSRASRGVIRGLTVLGSLIIALVAGVLATQRWQDVLLALYGGSFGIEDPTFGRDAGFYVFLLPVLRALETGLLALLIVTILAVALVYLIRLGIRFRSWGDVPFVALRHLSGLISAVLLVVAMRYLLNTFELVYSSRGVVTGPGFTDVNIVRPLNWLMALASALVAIGLLSGFILRNPKWLAGLLGSWFLLAVVVTPLLPMAVQRVLVEPNEFSREENYIERNIEMTRAGFALNDVQAYDVTGQEEIDISELSADEPPLDNVRIWDYRVVGPVFQQVQSFVPSYEFPDVDVDRYEIDGEPVQVLVGVRELNLDGLAENRRTWTNTHLVYTHGYGVVVSPVSEVSGDGWPPFIVSGIPMEGPEELALDRPEVYFGETDLRWIILFTDQTETTGLVEAGDAEVEGFQGEVAGSVSLGNPVTRGLAALTLGDRNVFLSSQLTGDSRLVLERNIVERAKKIAPFLDYDQDPYAVIADGRLYWVMDAYTTTSRFPQATRFDGTNYIRNSVKVVVDAYDGTTIFYRTGIEDQIADAWGDVYPDLFTPITEAPASLSAHFRYPERQFVVQSEVWSDYHMDDARTWYDGDDKWTVAEETIDGEIQQVEPFFVSQPLPGETESVFALTVPFTPGGQQTRQNMTAWFAGTADETGDTTLRLYRYPRQVTVYGPRQIEAQINQDPDISQQITLWGQGGSEVIRGNMLVIPVNDAILYVQPLYLQATGSSASAPRLARVIVATNDQVVMRPTLPEAIAALADPEAESVDQIEQDPDAAIAQAEEASQPGSAPQGTPVAEPSGDVPTGLAAMSEEELAAEALVTLDRAEQAQQAGDWETYGREQERLRRILEIMAGSEVVPDASPEAGS
ncbi:MAG TPA: UPF0182 family protein [Thermomicrobiales bacterium]|nr:UPF0182 family protein [Thermomicrobiales bacterium]